MADMSIAALARRLDVSQRRANQIVEAGEITAHRTDSGAWLVNSDSADEFARRKRHTRGLNPTTAWTLLFSIDDLDSKWVSERTRARVRRRIREHDAEQLAYEVAGRTRTHRFRAANIERAAEGLMLTGRSAINRIETDLMADRTRLFAYVPAGESVDGWASKRFLIADPSGDVVLYENTIPMEANPTALPKSVVAADLAVSADAREREAGIRALATMRDKWLRRHE